MRREEMGTTSGISTKTRLPDVPISVSDCLLGYAPTALINPLLRAPKLPVMLAGSRHIYPGEAASPSEIRLLADEYRKPRTFCGRSAEPASPCPGRPSAFRLSTRSSSI